MSSHTITFYCYWKYDPIFYRVIDDKIRPIYFYSVDVSEFAVNKLRDRGSLEVTTIVTNIQDFLVKLKENLV